MRNTINIRASDIQEAEGISRVDGIVSARKETAQDSDIHYGCYFSMIYRVEGNSNQRPVVAMVGTSIQANLTSIL